jgi:hypothetical protein
MSENERRLGMIQLKSNGEIIKNPVVITTNRKDLRTLKLLLQHWDKTHAPPMIRFPSGFELTVYPISGMRAIGEVFTRLKRCVKKLYSI